MMDEQQEQHICLDCGWHRKEPEMSTQHPGYCVHFTPEYWQAQGWERNWGDAAVGMWPVLEILRKATGTRVEFLVLCPAVRRPVNLYFQASLSGWGSF